MKKSIADYFMPDNRKRTPLVKNEDDTVVAVAASSSPKTSVVVVVAATAAAAVASTKPKKIRTDVSDVKDVEVTAVDVGGIMYYADKYDNVYEMEDVLGNKQNPKIISTLAMVSINK